MNPEIRLGLYRHYKGNLYVVFDVVKHSETEEQLILYGKYKPEWVRPVSSFLGFANTADGQAIRRFQFIGGGQENTPTKYSARATS